MSGMPPMDGTPLEPRPRLAQPGGGRGRVLALLGLVLVFVAAAGVASGVVLERRVLSRHGARGPWRVGELHAEGPRAMHERFGRDLGLSAAQAAKIDSIFASHRPAIDSARAISEPKIRAIIDQTRREIDSVLTPEQRAKMHARMMRERPPGDSTERPGGRRGPF